MAFEQLFSGMEISASGMSAQRKKMEVIANNIANAATTRTPAGGPFQRKFLSFISKIDRNTGEAAGVEIAQAHVDTSPPRKVYDPGHPDADAQGFVAYPNVQVVTEMVELMQATRGFEANVTVLNAVKDMISKALEIGR
ncbi:MAG: flagellar basal body rod protein FlgC [Candidatus Omnitrophica bacterium]|nr:flagellar basal body rod protein FlgC [Candidatus Omnitrophota bacterium]